MFYIEETDDELVKYEVELDTERLSSLKSEIIENCSEKSHNQFKCVDKSDLWRLEDKDIRNYKESWLGQIKYFGCPKTDMYKIEYDIYKHTPLVMYIDRLLQGDGSVIKELKEYKGNTLLVEKAKSAIKHYIDNIKKEINKEDYIKINAFDIINGGENIKIYQKLIELNKNQLSDMYYYDDVMKCITLTEVDRIDKAAIRRVEEFQGISYTKKNRH